jgi:hypothetical protein
VIRITRPDHEGDDYDFEFDGVFSPSASQTTVFESVRDLAITPSRSYAPISNASIDTLASELRKPIGHLCT